MGVRECKAGWAFVVFGVGPEPVNSDDLVLAARGPVVILVTSIMLEHRAVLTTQLS